MNLPNKLSLIRICLVPIIALVYLFPYSQFGIVVPVYYFDFVSISLVNIVSLIIFIIASITDAVDGYIARKYDQITTLGKFLDPIADKLLVNTMFLLFAVEGIIPIIPVVIMFSRDTIVDCIRMIASDNNLVMSAGMLGKVKTVTQMFAIILILLNNLPFELYRLPMNFFMLWFATSISVLSGISYYVQARDIIFESK